MFKRTFQRDAVFVMALYNIVVGAVFFFLYEQIFDLFGIGTYTPARPPAMQVPCLFLVVFGIGYLCAFHDMVRNRALLFVGLLQNAAIAGLAVWYMIARRDLMHDIYLLPAGISALFAIMFLIAWIGAALDAARQRRRSKRLVLGPAPRPTEAPAPVPEQPPTPETPAPEPPPEEPLPEEALPEEAPAEETPTEVIEDMPEPAPPRTPPEPDTEPPLRFLAHRDRSGIHTDEPTPPQAPPPQAPS